MHITPVPSSSWLQRKSADLYGCAMILCIDAEIREHFDDEAGAKQVREEAIRYQEMAAKTYLDSRVQYNRGMMGR